MKVFGCACYPLRRPYTSHTLDPRTKECLFLGYSTRSKGYLCLDLSTHNLYVSRHVLFNESKFPTLTSYSHSTSPSSVSHLSNALWLSNLLYLHASNQPSLLGPYSFNTTPLPHVTPSTDIPSLFAAHTSTNHPGTDHTLPSPFPNAPIALPTSSNDPSPPLPPTLPTVTVANQHPMQTRSESGIVMPELCYKAILDYTKTEPPSYRVASKYPVWCIAMDAEF